MSIYSIAQTNPTWQPANKEEVVLAYKKACNWFINTSTYSFNLKYTSYKNHTSAEVMDNSGGYYKRSGNKYVSEAVGVKTIQNEKVKMIVDTTEKMIAITNPGSMSPNIQSSEDLVKLLENVKSLNKKLLNNSTVYRIDFKKNEIYEAYEFSMNETGLLEKLVYFYSEQIQKDYGDGEEQKPSEIKIKPRLEVLFFNYQIAAKINESEFYDRSVVVAANNKVSLLNKYKSYQLKDYRLQDKK